MGRVFTQTASASVCGPIDTGVGLPIASATLDRLAVQGGAHDFSSTQLDLPDGDGQTKAAVFVEAAPGAARWDGGLFVPLLQVVTAPALGQATLEEIHVVRLNSSCAVEEVLHSQTGLSQAIAVGAIGSAFVVPTSDGDPTDYVYVVFGINDGGAVDSLEIMFAQGIFTPFGVHVPNTQLRANNHLRNRQGRPGPARRRRFVRLLPG